MNEDLNEKLNAQDNNDVEYLSNEGFKKLKAELELLGTEKRKEIAERLEYAKSLGDLSENAEYHQTKEEQIAMETRIAELEDMLGRAVIITKPASRVIAIGSTIFAQKQGSERIDRYFIVGSAEADPEKSKISNESPLGSSFLGKKKGEEVSVETPKGKTKYRIIDVL